MNIIYFLIATMWLIQFSIYAQSTAQVTLSIRLHPIQVIEVQPVLTQSLELSSQDDINSLNTSISSHQFSTYSTSHFELKVDSVKSSAFQQLHASSAVPPSRNRSVGGVVEAERYHYESDIDDLHVIYSMETL